mmetsp:Transcript_36579/g.116419  ORF Transcript_36579/g.116419 Transcript_36579/m.116419 type:complete len:224 (-) Transcript_36579:3008-3679(-)
MRSSARPRSRRSGSRPRSSSRRPLRMSKGPRPRSRRPPRPSCPSSRESRCWLRPTLRRPLPSARRRQLARRQPSQMPGPSSRRSWQRPRSFLRAPRKPAPRSFWPCRRGLTRAARSWPSSRRTRQIGSARHRCRSPGRRSQMLRPLCRSLQTSCPDSLTKSWLRSFQRTPAALARRSPRRSKTHGRAWQMRGSSLLSGCRTSNPWLSPCAGRPQRTWQSCSRG